MTPLFPLHKTSKTKNCENCFSKTIFKNFFEFFFSVSRKKKRKTASYRRSNTLGFPSKWATMNQSFFLRTSLRFYSALAILEPQIYVVVKQSRAENISLLSRRLGN